MKNIFRLFFLLTIFTLFFTSCQKEQGNLNIVFEKPISSSAKYHLNGYNPYFCTTDTFSVNQENDVSRKNQFYFLTNNNGSYSTVVPQADAYTVGYPHSKSEGYAIRQVFLAKHYNVDYYLEKDGIQCVRAPMMGYCNGSNTIQMKNLAALLRFSISVPHSVTIKSIAVYNTNITVDTTSSKNNNLAGRITYAWNNGNIAVDDRTNNWSGTNDNLWATWVKMIVNKPVSSTFPCILHIKPVNNAKLKVIVKFTDNGVDKKYVRTQANSHDYPRNTISDVPVDLSDANYIFNDNEDPGDTGGGDTGGGDTGGGTINDPNPYFSVGNGQYVQLDTANVQYNGSLGESDRWRRALHPWEFCAKANNDLNATQDRWIDLFPNANDFGTHFPDGSWIMLSEPQWTALINRDNGAKKVFCILGGNRGLLLFPDNRVKPSVITIGYTITESYWNQTLAPMGCIFLPCSGYKKEGVFYFSLNNPESSNNSNNGGWYHLPNVDNRALIITSSANCDGSGSTLHRAVRLAKYYTPTTTSSTKKK